MLTLLLFTTILSYFIAIKYKSTMSDSKLDYSRQTTIEKSLCKNELHSLEKQKIILLCLTRNKKENKQLQCGKNSPAIPSPFPLCLILIEFILLEQTTFSSQNNVNFSYFSSSIFFSSAPKVLRNT